jgi:hypothetical protein
MLVRAVNEHLFTLRLGKQNVARCHADKNRRLSVMSNQFSPAVPARGQSSSPLRRCDGVLRRDFLRVGGLTALGLGLTDRKFDFHRQS